VPQFFHHHALAAKLIQGGIGCGWVGHLVVQVEDILPGLTLYRTGFYLAKVGIVFRKHLKRRNQGSGPVFDRERDADLVRIGKGPDLSAAANQKKAGVVGRIVFDPRKAVICLTLPAVS
jgi:hypothetical protein